MNYDSYDKKTKVLDKKLFSFILRYLRPYLFFLIIALLLIFSISFIGLYLPYLLKIATDDYVESNKNALILENNQIEDFIKKYPKLIEKRYGEDKNIILFTDKEKNLFSKEDINIWKKNESLINQNVIMLSRTSMLDSLFKNNQIYKIDKNKVIVGQKDYRRLIKTIPKNKRKEMRKNSIEGLKRIAIIYFFLSFIKFCLFYLQTYITTYAAQHAMYDLRRDLFDHIQRLPVSFFDKNPIGKLVTRVTNDIRTLDEMLGAGLITMIQDSLVVVGVMIMMLILDWRFALISFITLPFIIYIMKLFRSKSRIIYRRVRKKLSEINSRIAEDLAGMKIIQLFSKEKDKQEKFAKINEEYYKATVSQMYLFAFFRPLINVGKPISIAIIIWYGGSRILNNYISLGVFLAFMNYLNYFFGPINNISEKFNVLQAAMSGIERIYELFQEKKEDYVSIERTDVKFKGDIQINNVSLAYQQGENVLKNISLSIKPGEKIALVGHTGSGKTSIVNMLLKMYPFQKGEILFDNKNINEYSLFDIRGNIGIVQQDPFLFSGNIKENISLNKEMSDEELRKIAQIVSIDDFIESLPNKYDEVVMERGSTLSVGQRQLIAFARVMAYDPAIFILDEATANIDTNTEILIQKALSKVMKNRTSVIIAHRLSTIKHVDKIIVLQKGEIVEMGNHYELLKNRGLYYDLYKLQYDEKTVNI